MASTVIGGSTRIEGELLSSEDVNIRGTVKGKIVVQGDLFVESSGNVEADVEADNVEAAGQVNGNMTARRKVEIVAGGHAVGDVRAQRILIADGAVFKGNVDMSAPSDAKRR
jgi:cytoskeletal protein CcmA (bactofilin family)